MPQGRASFPQTLAPGADLAAGFAALEHEPIATADDARAVAFALARLTPEQALGREGEGVPTLLHLCVALWQRVGSREAFEVIRVEGVPPLLALVDTALGREALDTETAEDVLFALNAAAMFRAEGVAERVATAARAGWEFDDTGAGAWWWSILSSFDDAHPFRLRLARALASPLPEGEAAVAYLAFANSLAREGSLGSHPFDTAEGSARLKAYLTPRPGPSRDAQLGAQALAFLGGSERDGLLALAADHPDPRVRIEAARVNARRGRAEAVDLLKRHALDPRVSRVAVQALTSIGRGGEVPAEALRPDFLALAELAHWLAHPNEFDRPPDHLALLDTRECFWPPAGDRRTLRLVGYRYDQEGKDAVEGFGLVGSVTFSRLGERIGGRSLDDLYALLCCWELQLRGEPRAPEVASVEAGRALLDAGDGSRD